MTNNTKCAVCEGSVDNSKAVCSKCLSSPTYPSHSKKKKKKKK